MLLRLWRNLDHHNSANFRILTEPNEEWTEPTLKNTDLDIYLCIHNNDNTYLADMLHITKLDQQNVGEINPRFFKLSDFSLMLSHTITIQSNKEKRH